VVWLELVRFDVFGARLFCFEAVKTIRTAPGTVGRMGHLVTLQTIPPRKVLSAFGAIVAEIVIFVVDGDSVFVENGDARKAFSTNVAHVGSKSCVGVKVITKISLFFEAPAAIVADELGKDRRRRDRRTFEKVGAEIGDGIKGRL
jgi:hypothetical protein